MNISDALIKEIDMIQNCITRMSNNSFYLKGWLVSIIVVAIGLLPDNFDGSIVAVIVLVVSFIFWYLDSFFLKMERLYRRKYEWVIAKRNDECKDHLFDLNPHNEEMWLPETKIVVNRFRVFKSETLSVFYGSIMLVTLIFLVTYIIKNLQL